MALQLVSPMHRRHSTRHIEILDAFQPCIHHHLFQFFLSWMHADGFGEERRSDVTTPLLCACYWRAALIPQI